MSSHADKYSNELLSGNKLRGSELNRMVHLKPGNPFGVYQEGEKCRVHIFFSNHEIPYPTLLIIWNAEQQNYHMDKALFVSYLIIL